MKSHYILVLSFALLIVALSARLSEAQFPGPIIGLLVPGAHLGAPPPPSQTIASIGPTSGSCATGTAGVTCATISVAMSPASPSFATDGGTYALVAAGGGCLGGDISDFTIGATTGIVTLSNASATVQVDRICVKATTTASNVTNSPRYQDVSVTVTSSGTATCGTAPVGAAAALVTEAGFATCATYNDFTTAIPNTVGTGLPSPNGGIGTSTPTPSGNWIDCNNDGIYTSAWATSVLLCSYFTQSTDPVSGALALHVAVTAAENQSGGVNSGSITSYGSNANWFPSGYYMEFTWHADLNYVGSGWVNIWDQADFMGSTRPSCYNGADQGLEVDFIEFDGDPPATDYGINWAAGGCNQSGGGSSRPFPYSEGDSHWSTQYNTIGVILTHDGNDNFAYILIFNGTVIATSGSYNTNPGFSALRHDLIMSLSGFANGAAYNFWLSYVKVWTCSGWRTSATSTCAGTGGYDSTNGLYAGAGG